jgi:hypothetical protein
VGEEVEDVGRVRALLIRQCWEAAIESSFITRMMPITIKNEGTNLLYAHEVNDQDVIGRARFFIQDIAPIM